MLLPEQLACDRAKLAQLLKTHPTWGVSKLAQECQHCPTWVRKWKRRFSSDPNPDLYGQANSSKKPKPKTPPLLLERISSIRLQPPDNLGRTPGPKTICHFLQSDPELKAAGITPPKSATTVWKHLTRLGFYQRPAVPEPKPLERAAPLESIAMDFKDSVATTVAPEGKKQHLVETLNFIDEGTSWYWDAVARDDFNATSVISTLFLVFERNGLPQKLRFDRDVRFVGPASGRDFPSALLRMLYSLGVEPTICPPHRPDKNPFVEQLNGNYGRECLARFKPQTQAEVAEVTAWYRHHYNTERPHQGKSCANRPPAVAFPVLPTLPSLPLVVDPDKWLVAVDQQRFARKVKGDGSIGLDKHSYYVGKDYVGQYVVVVVDAASQELVVEQKGRVIKRVAIKGLYKRLLNLSEWQAALEQEAKSEARGWRATAQP
jgi:hypothetical protein